MFNRRRTEDEAEGRPGMGDQGSAPRSAAEPETGAPADAEAEAGAGPNQAGAPESEESRERYLRLLADFQNYQRRALGNEREARVQGATGVLTSILPVLDNFDLALAQDPQSVTVQQMLEGSR
ncbi:MAG TPA: nucleotide exchange factor GrpE, partial [Phycisphaerales bacterium]|nr:nucleotide exchange factor GrpE [Phycisphaerales bacterium]